MCVRAEGKREKTIFRGIHRSFGNYWKLLLKAQKNFRDTVSALVAATLILLPLAQESLLQRSDQHTFLINKLNFKLKYFKSIHIRIRFL